MKTAEELYLKHNNITHGFEFREALAEHDKEIIEMIDEMQDSKRRDEMTIQDNYYYHGYITALTELKEKIQNDKRN